MTKRTNKKKKGIVDPYAFKGTERLDVVFTTNLPDYQGTEMVIEPKLSQHDQKVADFLTEQFLNKTK